MYAGQTDVTGTKAGSATHVSTMISDAANKWSKKAGQTTRKASKRRVAGQKNTRSKKGTARKRAKQEPHSQKRSLSPELKNSPGGKALVEYFSHKEEDPNSFIIRASQCFVFYEEFCVLEEVEPLSARAFSMMAQDYVRPFKRGGFHWYEVPHVEQEQSEGGGPAPKVYSKAA